MSYYITGKQDDQKIYATRLPNNSFAFTTNKSDAFTVEKLAKCENILKANLSGKKAKYNLKIESTTSATILPDPTISAITNSMQPLLNTCMSNISHIDRQIEDIMHYCEFADNQNAPRGYLLYQKIRDLRRDRRVNKDIIATIQSLAGASTLETAAERLKQQAAQLAAKKYTPRELDKWFNKDGGANKWANLD